MRDVKQIDEDLEQLSDVEVPDLPMDAWVDVKIRK